MQRRFGLDASLRWHDGKRWIYMNPPRVLPMLLLLILVVALIYYLN